MRSSHRHFLVFGAALLAVLAMTSARTLGQAGAAVASNDFPNPYRIENFGQLPAGRKIGQTYGIDIDRDGKSAWVFERCGGATCERATVAALLQFDSSGWLVASSGSGMF